MSTQWERFRSTVAALNESSAGISAGFQLPIPGRSRTRSLHTNRRRAFRVRAPRFIGRWIRCQCPFRRRSVSSDVSRMKASVVFGLLVTFIPASGCSHLQPAHDGVAVVEFERQEDNGSVNILPCTVTLSDRQKVTLIGGERAVVSVSPGSFCVTASSADPYSPNSRATAWRSPRTRFQVSVGERLQVQVEPTATGSTYSGGWTIRSANKITAHEPPLPVSSSDESVHRTLDSLPAPGSGGGR